MFTTEATPQAASFKLARINGRAGALLCVRLWNVLVSLLGLFVYLLGMHRSVYSCEGHSGEAAGYMGVARTN